MKPFPLLLIVLLTSCNSNSKNTDESQFFVIDYETAIGNKKTLNLTDFAKSVRYIPLETDSNCLLAGLPGYHFTEDYIFIENTDHVLMFDGNGNFIRRIGTPGKGPNEIDLIVGSSVIEEDHLITVKTLMTNKLLFFNYNGKLVESITPPAFSIFTIQEDTFLTYDMCSSGKEDYFFRLTTRKNDTLDCIVNPFKWQNNTGMYMMLFYNLFKPYYHYNDREYFKCMYIDTVFTISNKKITPGYLVNLGKYQLPIELRPENPNSKEQFDRVSGEHFYASSLENSGRIFITSNNYKDDMPRYILYDKKSGEGIYLVKEFDEASGFINDWDNGPEFWPEGNVNDNTLYMAVSPVKIKEIVESDQFKNASGNEKNKQALVDLAGSLKEEDNSVLMIVKTK